jgi:acid phosphatase family membrane protein YuiD
MKFLIVTARAGVIDYRQLYKSGSMPSVHSATSMALLTVVAFRDGIDSALFGIAALFTVIVMYDAVMVRRSTGEQGAAIEALIKEQKSKVRPPRAAKGHEPIEVAVGMLLGLIVGLFVFLATK